MARGEGDTGEVPIQRTGQAAVGAGQETRSKVRQEATPKRQHSSPLQQGARSRLTRLAEAEARPVPDVSAERAAPLGLMYDRGA